MQKNSVVQHKPKPGTKTSGPPACPRCGSQEVEKRGLNTYVCPNCGTEPWEASKKP